MPPRIVRSNINGFLQPGHLSAGGGVSGKYVTVVLRDCFRLMLLSLGYSDVLSESITVRPAFNVSAPAWGMRPCWSRGVIGQDQRGSQRHLLQEVDACNGAQSSVSGWFRPDQDLVAQFRADSAR
jgi:hypothetical protein